MEIKATKVSLMGRVPPKRKSAVWGVFVAGTMFLDETMTYESPLIELPHLMCFARSIKKTQLGSNLAQETSEVRQENAWPGVFLIQLVKFWVDFAIFLMLFLTFWVDVGREIHLR